MKLPPNFFLRSDVVAVARELLGMVLVTHINGEITAGRITETEAYRAPDDRACHAFGNRRTERTEVMFWQGGHAYVYLCYGIHHLFNVVTGVEEEAHAVLIRALEPLEGVEVMRERRFQGKMKSDALLAHGPGALAQAMGLHTRLTGTNMLLPESPVWIEDRGLETREVLISPRIGVDYARECALWPWRFLTLGSRLLTIPSPKDF